VPVRLYHYAAYFTPALIKHASGLPSYAAFAGILVPMGVFLHRSWAYVLVASFWGTWPGLAACGALLLLPDGAQQGMGNTFLSYHWLAQNFAWRHFWADPGCLVVAVRLARFDQGQPAASRGGMGFGGRSDVLQGALLLAIALLLICTPPLFLRLRLRLRYRICVAGFGHDGVRHRGRCLARPPGAASASFRWSATGRLLDIAVSLSDSSALKTFLLGNVGENKSWIPNVVLGAAYLLFGVLGVLAPAMHC